MSKAKFTKGYWKAQIFASGNHAYVWADDETCILENLRIAGCEKIVLEHHANAYLIAVAPEMYEFIESLQLSVADDVRREELLAKARGETE